MTKRISKTGTVQLPKELRSKLGIPVGCAVDVGTDGRNITICKHIPLCRFCNSAEDVLDILGIEICRSCATKIKEKVDTND